MNFTKNLRKLRGSMSRALFAKPLDINENTLRNYEEGKSLPNFEVAMRLCQLLDVDPWWLLDGDGDIQPLDTKAKAEEFDSSFRALLEDLNTERRELNEENRRLLKENADLRIELERIKARAAPEDTAAPEAARDVA